MAGIGKRFPPGVSGNKGGRPLGARDRLPRASMKAVFGRLVEAHEGNQKMVRALNRILDDFLKKPTLDRGRLVIALAQLWAQAIDRVEAQFAGAPPPVTTVIQVSGVFPQMLRPGGLLPLPPPEAESESERR